MVHMPNCCMPPGTASDPAATQADMPAAGASATTGACVGPSVPWPAMAEVTGPAAAVGATPASSATTDAAVATTYSARAAHVGAASSAAASSSNSGRRRAGCARRGMAAAVTTEALRRWSGGAAGGRRARSCREPRRGGAAAARAPATAGPQAARMGRGDTQAVPPAAGGADLPATLLAVRRRPRAALASPVQPLPGLCGRRNTPACAATPRCYEQPLKPVASTPGLTSAPAAGPRAGSSEPQAGACPAGVLRAGQPAPPRHAAARHAARGWSVATSPNVTSDAAFPRRMSESTKTPLLGKGKDGAGYGAGAAATRHTPRLKERGGKSGRLPKLPRVRPARRLGAPARPLVAPPRRGDQALRGGTLS